MAAQLSSDEEMKTSIRFKEHLFTSALKERNRGKCNEDEAGPRVEQAVITRLTVNYAFFTIERTTKPEPVSCRYLGTRGAWSRLRLSENVSAMSSTKTHYSHRLDATPAASCACNRSARELFGNLPLHSIVVDTVHEEVKQYMSAWRPLKSKEEFRIRSPLA